MGTGLLLFTVEVTELILMSDEREELGEGAHLAQHSPSAFTFTSQLRLGHLVRPHFVLPFYNFKKNYEITIFKAKGILSLA